MFGKRGLHIDSRLQIIEIAQFEEAKDRDDIKSSLEHLTNSVKLLLEERGQESTLAKMFGAEDDEENKHTARIKELSNEIKGIKNEISKLEKKRDGICSNNKDSMASCFLKSIDTSTDIVGKKQKDRESIEDMLPNTVTIDTSSAASPLRSAVSTSSVTNSTVS